jgi:hypothetical protein
MVPDDGVKDPRLILDLVRDLPTLLARLRICVVSGEVVPTELVQRFTTALPAAQLLN